MPGMLPKHLAAMGRHEDDEVAHVATGEVVVPRRIASQPDIRQQLIAAFERAGVPMSEFVVGGADDSRNPRTGLREYYGRGVDMGGYSEAIGEAMAERDGSEAERAGMTRDQAPSRASPGGGYHGPGGAVSEGGYTAMGRDIAPPGLFERAVSGLLGHTTIGKIANMLTPDRNVFDMSDPRNWATPNQPERRSGIGTGDGGPGVVSASGVAGVPIPETQYRGFYTPPPSPNVPTWQKYLDA